MQRVGNKLFFDKRDNSDFGEFDLPDLYSLENDVMIPRLDCVKFSLNISCFELKLCTLKKLQAAFPSRRLVFYR